MLDAIRRRAEKDEEGFTLIELMVVVLIIGILVAIAVPTFLKAQDNAKGKAAASNLRSSLSAAKTFYTDNQSYTGADATAMEDVEPSLTWSDTNSTSPEVIAIGVGGTGGTVVGLTNQSKAGICYLIIDNTASGGGTTYAKTKAAAATCAPVTDASTLTTTVYAFGSTPNAAQW